MIIIVSFMLKFGYIKVVNFTEIIVRK